VRQLAIENPLKCDDNPLKQEKHEIFSNFLFFFDIYKTLLKDLRSRNILIELKNLAVIASYEKPRCLADIELRFMSDLCRYFSVKDKFLLIIIANIVSLVFKNTYQFLHL
jgi:hypothetical protein